MANEQTDGGPAKYTDFEMLNWLERQNALRRYSGRCIFRWSSMGRGWRLHETSEREAWPTVRRAIAEAMEVDERAKSPRETQDAHLSEFGQ